MITIKETLLWDILIILTMVNVIITEISVFAYIISTIAMVLWDWLPLPLYDYYHYPLLYTGVWVWFILAIDWVHNYKLNRKAT